jgi:hypothetical protein
MGEGIESLFWHIRLGLVCNYCPGSPKGKRDQECSYYRDCHSLKNYDSFAIPHDKNKIQSYIQNYREGKTLFELAQLMWDAKTAYEISEKAENCPTKILPIPKISELMKTRLREYPSPEAYMEKRLEELENLAKSM